MVGDSWGMILDEIKRQGLKFLRGILRLALRRMENFLHSIQWQGKEHWERTFPGLIVFDDTKSTVDFYSFVK